MPVGRDPKTGRFVSLGRKVRRAGRRIRNVIRRERSRPMGMGGRIGAFVMGAVPMGISGIDAAAFAMEGTKALDAKELSMVGKAVVGLERFVNNLAYGFGLDPPFKTMMFYFEKGGYLPKNLSDEQASGVPKGAWIGTTLTGLGMIALDRAAGWLAGKKGGVKIPFTNYLAVGGK